MMKNKATFASGHSYHVFNRANGSDKLFIEKDNYRYFLAKFKKYILPIADVFAYNLLPNHFHFQIRIKDEENLLRHHMILHNKLPVETRRNWINDFVIQQFSNFLNCYAKSFNNKYGRIGSLFMSNLKRVLIESDAQFTATIFYIHKNAVHHGYVKNIEDWKFSSYLAILSNGPTLLLRNSVIEWFGSMKAYIEYHRQPIFLKYARVIE